jgi:acetoacetyl-CoA synthetase
MTAPPKVLWVPDADAIERATLTRFSRWLEETRDLDLPDYHALWRWSVDDLEGFWGALAEYCSVRFSTPPERVLGRREMPGAEWFPGARLNYAEHLMRGHQPGAVAFRHLSELRPQGVTTWAELELLTARIAGGLRALGVEPGDRVAAFMPNLPETAAAFLATASLGAVWSSAAPEFGPRAVADRFGQIEPKVLLVVDGYRYGGKDVSRLEQVAALRAELPTVEHVVVLGYLDPEPSLAGPGDALRWEALLDAGAAHTLAFEQVPFDHPLWVLYTSGTTGLPKPIVHGHGGILLELLKKMRLHLDLSADDRFFWFTTTGWMMWNFLLGGLLTDAEVVLYDGSPTHPGPDALFDVAERAGISVLGTSAAYLGGCLKADVHPRDGRSLPTLRAIGSTGSPLAPESFDWVYRELGPDLWLFSTSGGTDIGTAFVGGVPTLPVVRGELQARSLGARIEAWSPAGAPLVGEVGELVITAPMPSMPLFLWGDVDGARYRESYFSRWPGVWSHGDWIELTERGSAIITGRSDATINRGGVRIGTAELYRPVLAQREVADALAVDVPSPGTAGQLLLFVVLREGAALDDELAARLRAQIRSECSPRHVPDEIVAVPDVPRTLSGKLLEVPVKRMLTGTPAERAVSEDALANPQALAWFASFADARRQTATGR